MELLYKKELNPSFWHNNSFDPKLRKKILKIVSDFLKDIKLEVPINDITLTGSIANYTYNKYSDLDIHIILDFKKINEDEDLVKDMLDGKRFIWNLRHDIMLKGHEIEVYFEDKKMSAVKSGVYYSLLNNKWLKEPSFNPPKDVDLDLLKIKIDFYTDLVNRLSNLLNETDDRETIKLIHNKSKKIKDKIMSKRDDAIKERGEFALENLLFKKLRNNDTIEKLIDVINGSYDKFFMESLSFNKTVLNFIKK